MTTLTAPSGSSTWQTPSDFSSLWSPSSSDDAISSAPDDSVDLSDDIMDGMDPQDLTDDLDPEAADDLDSYVMGGLDPDVTNDPDPDLVDDLDPDTTDTVDSDGPTADVNLRGYDIP